MDINDLLKAAVDSELRRIDEERLLAVTAELVRRMEGPAFAFPCGEASLDTEEREERLVTYLLESSGEPPERVWEFLRQDSLVLLPRVAGARILTCSKRAPIVASQLLYENHRNWTPGKVKSGAALVSPTHPELVARGVASLEHGRVHIDAAELPAGVWVLLALSDGASPGETPYENLLALYRKHHVDLGTSAPGVSALRPSQGG